FTATSTRPSLRAPPRAVISSWLAPATVSTMCWNERRTDLLASAMPATVATPSATPTTVRALRTRCSVQFGQVTRRRRCRMSDAGRPDSLPEVSLLPGIPRQCAPELAVRQVGPQGVGEPELGVRRLHGQEPTQASMSPRAHHEVHGGDVRRE